ncbi:hypothetical protein ACKVWC_000041 [Pyricularia oryzae]
MDIVEGSVVAIYSEKSKWVPLVQIAVYKAGGVTVLQSVAVPELRMAKVFENIGVKLAVISESRLEVVSSHARCCTVNQFLQAFLHDHNKNLPKALPLLNITSPAAILVFSNSTGEPKQVLWNHGTLFSNAKAHGEYLGVYPGTRVFQFASYDFNVSTIESISTLVHAGCLCIPSESDRRNDITGAFNRMDYNYSYFTPSVAKSLDPAALPGLRTLTMGGEPIQSVEVARWTQAETIIGIYGPAECAQALTFALLSPTTRNNHVGRPYGANVWLLEPGRPNCLAGVGTTAELAIESPTLSRGYFGDPARSAAVYVENPSWLSRGAEGHAPRRAIIYITGNLARYGADGSLDFIGRKDALVKLRGQRIELAEVEYHVGACLRNAGLCRGIAAEIVTPKNGSSPIFVVFLNVDESRTRQETESKLVQILEDLEQLPDRVPQYMVPGAYIKIDQIPMTTTNKTDRRALRKLGSAKTFEELAWLQFRGKNRRPPTTSMEKRLRNLWSSVLQIDPENIGADSSFFKISGESIAAMRLIAAARAANLSLTVA